VRIVPATALARARVSGASVVLSATDKDSTAALPLRRESHQRFYAPRESDVDNNTRMALA
jgi:hypothetical protein